jgi:hypothetical protein
MGNDESIRVLRQLTRDIEVLVAARSALLALPEGADASRSFVHFLVVLVMNSFDAVFKSLPKDDELRRAYSGLKAVPGVPSAKSAVANDDRADDMIACLHARDLTEYDETVRAFFALKKLRNKLAHGDVASVSTASSASTDAAGSEAERAWTYVRDVATRMIGCVLRWAHDPFEPERDETVFTLSDMMATIASGPSPAKLLHDADAPWLSAWRTIEAVHCMLIERRVHPRDRRAVGRKVVAAWGAVRRWLPPIDTIRASRLIVDALAPVGPRAASIDGPLEHLLGGGVDIASSLDADDGRRFAILRLRASEHAGPIAGSALDEAVPEPVAAAFVGFALREDRPEATLAALRCVARCRRFVPNVAAAGVFRDEFRMFLGDEQVDDLRRAAEDVRLVQELIAAWYDWSSRSREVRR